jgi:hypothetical protein
MPGLPWAIARFCSLELTLPCPSAEQSSPCRHELGAFSEQLFQLPERFSRTRCDAITPAPELEDRNRVRRDRFPHLDLQFGFRARDCRPSRPSEASGSLSQCALQARDGPLRRWLGDARDRSFRPFSPVVSAQVIRLPPHSRFMTRALRLPCLPPPPWRLARADTRNCTVTAPCPERAGQSPQRRSSRQTVRYADPRCARRHPRHVNCSSGSASGRRRSRVAMAVLLGLSGMLLIALKIVRSLEY